MHHHPNWQPRLISVHLMSVLERFVCIFILEKFIGSAFMKLKCNVHLNISYNSLLGEERWKLLNILTSILTLAV